VWGRQSGTQDWDTPFRHHPTQHRCAALAGGPAAREDSTSPTAFISLKRKKWRARSGRVGRSRWGSVAGPTSSFRLRPGSVPNRTSRCRSTRPGGLLPVGAAALQTGSGRWLKNGTPALRPGVGRGLGRPRAGIWLRGRAPVAQTVAGEVQPTGARAGTPAHRSHRAGGNRAAGKIDYSPTGGPHPDINNLVLQPARSTWEHDLSGHHHSVAELLVLKPLAAGTGPQRAARQAAATDKKRSRGCWPRSCTHRPGTKEATPGGAWAQTARAWSSTRGITYARQNRSSHVRRGRPTAAHPALEGLAEKTLGRPAGNPGGFGGTRVPHGCFAEFVLIVSGDLQTVRGYAVRWGTRGDRPGWRASPRGPPNANQDFPGKLLVRPRHLRRAGWYAGV